MIGNSFVPVQKPGHFGAGHGVPEPGSFRCQGGRLEHPPGKVPLLHTTEGDGIAVNRTLQVGVDPALGTTQDYSALEQP